MARDPCDFNVPVVEQVVALLVGLALVAAVVYGLLTVGDAVLEELREVSP